MTRPAEVVVDLAALTDNFNRVRDLAPRSRVIAVVKANAYGHGVERVARALREADAFGVACLEEARVLRRAGIKQRVVLLEGCYAAAELDEAAALRLDPVVHENSQIEMLEQARPPVPLDVWLKIDTGMHRLGFDARDAGAVYRRLRALDSVATIRLMSHFANANARGDTMTGAQLRRFLEAGRALDAEWSIANSAGVLAYPEAHGDWVRPGIMLYGVSPFDDGDAVREGLTPVMTLRSRLISVRRLRAGEPVGYAAAWRCPEDMPVGVVAVGYGDGYPRHARAQTPMLVAGGRAGLVGYPSMDMLSVDLRRCPHARVGDRVVLWGGEPGVGEIAGHAGTTPYALLTAVRRRLNYRYCESRNEG